MRKIYSFDFDGTIVKNKFPDIGEPIQDVIQIAIMAKLKGDYVILNTMREGKYLEDALKFCKSVGIEFDAVNDNLEHMKEFYQNNPRKIYADYYIDDHNFFVESIN